MKTLSLTSATNSALINLTTTYQYDALDRVIRVTDPLGNIAETVFDGNGKVKQINAYYKNGTKLISRVIVTRTYDLADRLATETDIYGNTSTYTYDAAGNLIQSVDANGHISRFEYDAMNRRTAVVDANGYRTVTTYDLAGHPIAVTNPNGKTTRSTYDALGRLSIVTTPLGFITQFGVDANNNVTSIIDANAQAGLQSKNTSGNTVTRQYDELNRLIKETDAINGITLYGYDLVGDLTSLTDASGKVTTNVYDGLSRLITVIDPLIETPVDKVVSYTWDEAGNMLTKTDRLGKVTRITYDTLNRPYLSEYLTDATTETIVYDLYGNRYTVSNGAVTYTYGYDLKNRMMSKTDSRLGKSISYTYDKVGNIQTKTDYQGDITTYEYDSSNRLVAESNPAYLSVSYQYDGASRLLGRILSNGTRTSYNWDDDDRLTSLASISANGTAVSNATYTRDRVGNILTTVDLNGSTTYTYDPLYRLATAAYPNTAFNETFTYDAVGNRQIQTKGGAAHAYEYVPSSNRLKAIHTTSLTGAIEKAFTYSDEDQLISQTGIGAKTIIWDQKGRPTSISPSGTVANTFNYDPMDRRIFKFDSHGNQSALLEGDHLEAIYSGSSLEAKYMRGAVIDEVVNGYQFDTTGTWTNYTFHHDSLQSLKGLSGHDGTILTTQTYTAFGESMAATGTSNNSLKYTGRELDSDSGCYQYRARYYCPDIGRFLSNDPLGFKAGVNFAVYVNNNAVNGNDPSGLIDITYSAGSLNPITTNVNAPGTNYFVAGSNGATYPMGAGVYQRTVQQGKSFDAVFDVQQTAALIDWGRSFIQNNRLFGATGDASLAETAIQSMPGGPWDTKQYLPYTSVYAINGKAELRDYVGNAIWATGINSLGISQSTALLGANIQGSFSSIGQEDPRDQEAIRFGYTLPTSPQLGGATGSWGNSSGASGSWDSSAAGGFLLYPNKSNTNQMQSVYKK